MRTDGLYDDLIAAAIELASPRLPLAIPSLRAVARACGVSATAVYRYFDSQSSLTQAILMSIESAFVAALAGADDPGRPPRERLRRLAHAYLGWGLANPGLYQLRFESTDRPDADHVRTRAADDMLVHIDSLITASASASQATAEDLWVGMHGLVSLRIHKPDRPWKDVSDAQIERFLAMWDLAV